MCCVLDAEPAVAMPYRAITVVIASFIPFVSQIEMKMGDMQGWTSCRGSHQCGLKQFLGKETQATQHKTPGGGECETRSFQMSLFRTHCS